MEYKDRIAELARFDPWYQRCLKDVQEKEQAFLAIHEMLTEEQQLQLDRYIAAREELEHALIPIAYHLGRGE